MVVDNDANVNLIRENNNASSNAANNNLNAQTDFEGTMKLSSLQMDAGQFTVDVIDDNQSNVKIYKASLKVVAHYLIGLQLILKLEKLQLTLLKEEQAQQLQHS